MIPRPKAILDTCVLVDIIRGTKKDLSPKLRQLDIERCCITDLTRFELLCGAESSDNPVENTALVNDLCAQFRTLPTSCGHELAAKEKARLKRHGTSIPDIDLLIGAVCASEGVPLVTGNARHLSRITGIEIIPW